MRSNLPAIVCSLLYSTVLEGKNLSFKIQMGRFFSLVQYYWFSWSLSLTKQHRFCIQVKTGDCLAKYLQYDLHASKMMTPHDF